jgi:hypothetical protein
MAADMFRISMLPANHGDCIWLEYGLEAAPRRVMIDGGPPYAFPQIKERLPAGGCHFELLVITHIDADHIGGALELLTQLPDGVSFGDIWFNGWKHLPSDLLGPAQGEMVSAVIEHRGLPWNAAFDGAAVSIPDDGALPRKELEGGLTLTVLSPTRAELTRLRPKWKDEVEKAGIAPGSAEDALRALRERAKVPVDLLGDEGPPDPDQDILTSFIPDDAVANGSSIVLLAQYDDGNGERKSALLCGDAYPSLVERGLGRLSESGRLTVDALKVSHHGSKKNTDEDLIKSLTCGQYLVSTNSSIFGHPDNAALARIVKYGGDSPTLCFNYRTSHTEPWEDERLRSRYGYATQFPPPSESGLAVTL